MIRKVFFSVVALFIASFSLQAGAEADYAGKKILYVGSYHTGYPWSDGIAAGIENALEETGVELKRVEMDTKRNTSEAFKEAAALDCRNREFQAGCGDCL